MKDGRKKTRIIAANILDVVFCTDGEGVLIIVNEDSLKRYGYKDAEVSGCHFLPFVHEADRLKVLRYGLGLRRGKGKRSRDIRFRIHAKSGEACWVEAHAHACYDRKGRYLGTEGVLRDITDCMRTQRDQERLAAQLAQSQKMEAVGRLADGFTHDFNNILSGILGLTEIVVSRLLPPESPACAYLEDILDAGGDAKARIAQIRSFGISGKGKREICRLPEILEAIVLLVEETLPAGARLNREILWKDAEILADEVQIRQMVLNLLTNAVQALNQSPGDITVSLSSIEFSDPPFPHPGLTQGKYACLIISDTGEGIPAGSLDRIFDPYVTTRKALGGKGLGLTVVYGIVRRYGGVVAVESEAGKGSVFTVYLPAIPESNPDKLSRMQ